MRREEILKIMEDAFAKKGNFLETVIEATVHITEEIASRVARPLISEMQWSLLVGAIRAEPKLFQALSLGRSPHGEVVFPPLELLEICEVAKRGVTFILDNYEDTSSAFKDMWPKDTLVRNAGTITAEYEAMVQELSTAETFTLPQKRVNELVDALVLMEIGLLKGAVFSLYTSEVSDALKTIRESLPLFL
jgi:hypothetical protein